MVEVTQEDLDAAADLIESYWSGADANMMRLAKDTRNGHRQGAFPRAFAKHRTTALAAKEAENAELRAKVEKLREALYDAICMIGHAMPMDTTVLAGQRLVAREVWQTGYDLLHPKPKKETA